MNDTPVGLLAALEAYLAVRRGLGHLLSEEERHIRHFLEHLASDNGPAEGFTAAQATAWAHGTGAFKNSYQCQRLSAVRGFARYCRAAGLDVQVPAANALRAAKDRRVPHIYSQDEIDALIDACPRTLAHPLAQTTMAVMIGLLAVTGMRPGEALRLDVADIDPDEQTILIRANKHGPDRTIPVHPTTIDALAAYQNSPARQAVAPPVGPLLVTVRGTRHRRCTVEGHFGKLREQAGLAWEGTVPCLHDLRHTFATRQMIRAYTADDGDPATTMGLLAVWLGHSDPAHTYWYLQAVPELLALAAARMNP